MRPRTLLVLFLLVAALAAWVWFVERDLPSSEERVERAKRVFPIEVDEVAAVAIERDGARLRLERRTDEASAEGAEGDGTAGETGWRLVEPLGARADASLVDGLVSSLVLLEKERTLTEAEPANLGLAPPRATVELTLAEKDEDAGALRLLVGGEVPASSTMVVATEPAGPFHVVSDSLWTDLSREPGDWRSREVFSGERSAIDRVSLAAGEERVLLARRGEEFWLEAPLTDRGDEGTVSRFLTDLVGARVETFLDEPEPDLVAMGLEPPRGRVEVVLEGKEEPFVLELGATVDAEEGLEGAGAEEEPAVYARTGSLLFTTTAPLAEALERPAGEWRSLAWTSAEVYEMDRVEVSGEGGDMVLERAEGEWLRDGAEVPYATATDFIYALTGVKADRLEAGSEALGRPLLEVRLDPDDSGKAKETLRLYAQGDGAHPATVTGRDALLWLPASLVQDLLDKLQALREAEPAEPETQDAAATPVED